ncbi:MAG: type I secretion system permease/ATPase [Pseudomonadota bacterium]|nr:type I secretion system permease/ATPase [Pseudomonadota bacterium]
MNPNQPQPQLLTDPGPFRRLLLQAAGWSVVINLLALVQPIFMLHVYDSVLSSQSRSTLAYLVVIALFLIGISGVLSHLRAKLMMDAAHTVDGQARDRVMLGALAETLRTGRNVHSRFSGDLDTIRNFFSGGASLALMDLPWTPIFLIALLLISPPIALLVAVFGGLVFAAAVISDKAVRPWLEQASERLGVASRTASNIVIAADAVRAMGFAGNARRKWASETLEAAALQRRASERINASSESVKSLRIVLQVLVLAGAALLVLQGELTPGAMIACSIIGARALQPLDQVSNGWRQVVLSRLAWRKLALAAFEADRNTRPRTSLPPPQGGVSLTDVSVLSLGRPEPLLKRVTLDIPPGAFVGVIGPSGSGKSTVLRVIAGATPPAAGSVAFDGADANLWGLDALGAYVGYFPQSPALVAGTVAENIRRLGARDDEGVIAAAKFAGAHDMILSLAKGYDTEVGDGGNALSGGQRARVALARACYGDPVLYVLDEPFAHLDNEGERALWTMLRSLRQKRRTVLLATHRPSHLKGFDLAAVMNEGRLMRFGPANDIMQALAGPPVPASANA